jgi:hypothetical protein
MSACVLFNYNGFGNTRPMTYPFPGMNPWLENSALWRDAHHRLITAMADDLAPQLAPRYFVAVETHTYITRPEPHYPQTRYPGAVVVSTERKAAKTAIATMPEPSGESIVVELSHLDPFIEGFLEVRLVPGGEVVTVIELLSHTNKRTGNHRDEYLEKRAGILNSKVHFVEIDLLRAGYALPDTDPRPSHYRIFVRRRENHFQARVYPFNWRQPIPQFPLPLLPGDHEPVLNLGALLKNVYDRARYDLVIDYTRQPDPPLDEADFAWANELLQASEKHA